MKKHFHSIIHKTYVSPNQNFLYLEENIFITVTVRILIYIKKWQVKKKEYHITSTAQLKNQKISNRTILRFKNSYKT